jgi:N-acetylmuramoyl-L-alanine amidase
MLVYPKAYKLMGEKPRHHNGLMLGGDPRWVIHHYTVSKGNGEADAKMLFGKNEKQVSVQFVIGAGGRVYQICNPLISCNQAGKSQWKGVVGLNRHSIGIEYVNYGFGFPEKHHSSVMLAHRNDPRKIIPWEVFPDVQIDAGVKLTEWLFENIPTLEESLGHDDISPGRKSDPGPAFERHWPKFKSFQLR